MIHSTMLTLAAFKMVKLNQLSEVSALSKSSLKSTAILKVSLAL